MNINNKINKISKLIINNKELLNIKYKERNDLLENISKNKDVKYDDLDKLDEYIENIEFENESLEKDLEKYKKQYDLNIKIKKDKTRLCSFYKLPKGCDKGSDCSFAHNEIELKKIIKPCFSGLKCYKKDCYLKYSHPEGWDYKNNIIICNFFKNGYCVNENNCRFEHVKENYEISDNNIKENINNDIELHKNKYDYIKDIVKRFIHEDIIYGIIEDNKKQYNNNLSLNFKIIVDGIEYKNEESIFNDYNENNKVELVNISSDNQRVENKNIDIDDISDDTIALINNLQDNFYKYIKEIKRNIDEKFINDKEKHGIYLKSELNKIISELLLFKNNFKDITYFNKNKGSI